MEELFKIFDKKLGSSKISACLAICGYTEIQHFASFNAESLANMEKYIGKACFLMKKEDRKKYIDEIFIDNPKEFIFPPRCTDEIMKIVASIKELLDINNMPKQNMNISISDSNDSQELNKFNTSKASAGNSGLKLLPKIEKSDYFINLKKQSHLFKSIISPIGLKETSYNEISLNSCYSSPVCEDKINENDRLKLFYESIKDRSHRHFSNCNLEPYIDFEVKLYEVNDVFYNCKAYFICKLCTNTCESQPGVVVRFDITRSGTVIYRNIKIHLAKHFQALNKVQKKTNNVKRRSHKTKEC